MSSTALIFGMVVGLSLCANALVGFIRVRGTTFKTYAADPNRYPGWLVAMSLTGTVVGGGMFLATGQIGFEAGILGFIIGFVYLAGLCLMGSFARLIRELMEKEHAETLIDLIEKRLSNRAVVVFSVVSALISLFLLAGQFVAVIDVAEFLSAALGNPVLPRILTGLALVLIFLYPVFGGLRKDIQTDIFQVLLVVVATVPLVRAFLRSDIDWSEVELPPELLTGRAYGLSFVIGAILFFTPAFLVRLDFWQRVRAAKNGSSALWGFILAGVLSLFFFVFFTGLGMWARAMGVDDARRATLAVIQAVLKSPWELGLVYGGFFAAVLSTADTLINGLSLFVTRLLRPRLWRERAAKDGSEQADLLRWSRGAALLCSCLALVLAVGERSIVDLMVGALSLLLIFLPLVISILTGRRTSDRPPFWSAVVGALAFLPLFLFWNPKLAFAPAVLLAIATYVVLAAIEKARRLA